MTRRSVQAGIITAVLVTAGCAVGTRANLPFVGNLLAQDVVYQCPMDPDVRENAPGKCRKCGMTLVAGLPEPTEFPMDFSVSPQPVKLGAPETLTFTVLDPQNGKQTEKFTEVHERLFHLFIIGADLSPATFIHDHPIFGDDHKFRYAYKFPKPGMYRVLGDFYPTGATPQLNAKTVIVSGANPMQPIHLVKNYDTKQMENMKVTLTTEPPQPIAGMETRIFLKMEDSDGMELYLGAWAHMLAASDDVIDLIHSHPYQADGSPDMQFRVYFPRPRGYRVWFQFQKKGVVNTAYFDIPVKELTAE
jgi:Heavy metal binding domain